MFDDFALDHIDVGAVTLRVRHGGHGPPIVLLHGHPRTHVTWWQVAPDLARDFTVICPDLRGYGRSTQPADGDYSKRAMAADIAALLDRLGFATAAVAGHDRGCYVAMRVALDHAERVTHLGVLDGVPIGETLARADARFAAAWWHWFFFAQTRHPAEEIISADPEAWYRVDRLPAAIREDVRAAVRDPAVVAAMVGDYRAGLGPDRAADDADRAVGHKITCPTLFAWSTRDDMVELYGDPTAIWRDWAPDVVGTPIESGHHMAEENPAALAAALRDLMLR